MAYRLLLTLRMSTTSKTLSFDESVQTVLWLGMDARVGADNALARIELGKGTLALKASRGVSIVASEGQENVSQVLLSADSDMVLALESAQFDEPVILYARPVTLGMRQFRKLVFSGDTEFIVGRNRASGFHYGSRFVSAQHARITYTGGRFSVTDQRSGNGTMVNGNLIPAMQAYPLEVGDVVQILDLTMLVGCGFLDVNEPPGLVIQAVPGMDGLSHEAVIAASPSVVPLEDEPALFYPAPRLSKSIHPLVMQVDDPPSKKEEEDQPVLMQIGPSFLMGITSVFMVANTISRLAEGGSFLSIAPTVAMAIAMVGGSVIWPMISRAYSRRRDERDEARRSRLYVSYLDGVENKLANEAAEQTQILQENRRPVTELMERAQTLSPMLMNHTSVHDDFMDLRVGVGDLDVSAEVGWPERHFSLANDRMLDRVTALSKNPPMLRDVPLAFNPAKHHVAGILGERRMAWEFLRGLLVQICSLYSYQEVKIILVADKKERSEWDFLTSLGHFYDDAGISRLIALTYSGMVEQDLLVERELDGRKEGKAEVLGDYGTYYVVVCTDTSLAERSEAIGRLLKLRINRGFSLIYLGRDLRDLPRECGFIIDLTSDGSINLGISLEDTTKETRQRPRSARMFERSDVSGTLRQFDPDIMVTSARAHQFALDLARVRLDLPEQRSAMPDSLGFLEMFQVGNVMHLNVGQRWSENDASQSLQTPIGINEQGEHALLNLHENIHGPHGLIAGTTGSGKSEFIITYILSMCVSYAPDEVAFVLIDYKGGGLAGAFDNERYHLPHLAGTITNLDGSAIHRSLVSIQSELRRRQDMFNKARDITGEATMDIYKYLSYYRQGVLRELLPHLFIVADEFAELKQQEPEFMDELVSAARIGRSLGVHLILATQKPTGVVDDQIWSNSRFKVSLKVSDAADSREMIRRDDAAEITRPGQFYLLVGYNESFSGGQAAYAGASYVPSDRYEPRRDNAVELLDDEGQAIVRLRPVRSSGKQDISELNAVLGQITEAARTTGKHAERLWLDPLPDYISLASIDRRYGALPTGGLKAVVGELDDPENQNQDRFVVDISSVGNVALYGSPNSGVDGLLQTMLASLAKSYGPDRLWFYCVDLGPGVLAALTDLPQCGGVVLPGDDERVENLFRMIKAEMAERRNILAPYSGSIEDYDASSGSGMPRIVVAVSNYASLIELYPDLEDDLASITRDAPRYGIHFVVSAAAANTLRMRVRANFATEIPTMLNDPSDYLTLLGSLGGQVAPQQVRRGLVKQGKRILEFQGASLADDGESDDEVITRIADASCMPGIEARPIPQLPAYVHMENMLGPVTAQRLPVGYAKRGVSPAWFDLSKSPYLLLMGNENDSISMYLRALHEAYRASEVSYCFIDPQCVLGGTGDTHVLSYDEHIEQVVDGLLEGTIEPEVLVFTSAVQTIASMPTDVSEKLQDYIAKERGVGRTSLVVATEAWRTKGIYADWYKVVSAYGNGVWCGSGFSDQTTFRFSRSLPEYRQPAGRSDGFVIMRGNVESVRLLEAAGEPTPNETE